MTTWKQVSGFEGIYEVSDLGQVRSLTRTQISRSGHPQTFKGKILKPDVDKDGYYIYRLQNSGKRRTVKAHRLVAETFIRDIPGGMHVTHNDGNPANNSKENLRIATCRENHYDKYRHKRMPMGDSSGKSKLNTGAVLLLRKLSSAGASNRSLSGIFGITPTQVGRIVRREFWRHI